MLAIFTQHARARMQRRGASAAAIDRLLRYGAGQDDRHGASVSVFGYRRRLKQRH